MEIVFEIPLTPKSQKRDRIGTFGGHGRSYKDPAQKRYEMQIAALIAQHRPEKPLEGALELSMVCYLPIPVSKSKKWKAAALNYEIRPTTKPDCTNLAKNIEDIMSGVFYRDDAQICKLIISKLYSDNPRWFIKLACI
jgi:Holliday junction resolvase RusA-like endonuclease